MLKTRIIPVLLLHKQGLVKTTRFRRPSYVGDPLNSVRIFNEKEVDELVFLDICASREGRTPDFSLLTDIASEAFMPMAYGGGLWDMESIRRVLALGFEKVVLGSASYHHPELLREAVATFGAQSIVASVDVGKTRLGRRALFSHGGKKRESVTLMEHLTTLMQQGVGEILLTSIDRDGTLSGYDLPLIREVCAAVSVPVVAAGGARGLTDFRAAAECGASAAAAGAAFVYVGKHRGVLLNYPSRKEINTCLQE